MTISPQTVQTAVRPEGSAVSYDDAAPPGPGDAHVDPPGLRQEADLGLGVGADQTEEDDGLLPALVAVHRPHLHPGQVVRLPEQISRNDKP